MGIHFLPTAWLESLPLPSDFTLADIRNLMKNGYLLPGDLIAAARAGDQKLIVIGKGRPPHSRRKESPWSVAFHQWAIDHLKKEGGHCMDKAALNAAWGALPAEVKRTHNSFPYMFKRRGNGGGIGLTMDLLYAELEKLCIQDQHGRAEKRPASPA